MFTDIEFEIMDELYFVISFDMLSRQLPHISQNALILALEALCEQGYVRCMSSPEEAMEPAESSDTTQNSWYLATKKGLLAHTSL